MCTIHILCYIISSVWAWDSSDCINGDETGWLSVCLFVCLRGDSGGGGGGGGKGEVLSSLLVLSNSIGSDRVLAELRKLAKVVATHGMFS